MSKKQFTEADLVAFGNYLLNRKTIKKTNRFIVTDADISNFKESLKPKPKK